MEPIVAGLLVWIAAHSAYPVAGVTPPALVLVSAEKMADLVSAPAGHVHGFFVADEGERGTIYLVRPEDTPRAEHYPAAADNPWFRERLLHELVHYAQHVSGEAAQWRCPSQGEFRAYLLGGRYLREAGVPDPLPNRRFSAFVATGC